MRDGTTMTNTSSNQHCMSRCRMSRNEERRQVLVHVTNVCYSTLLMVHLCTLVRSFCATSQPAIDNLMCPPRPLYIPVSSAR